jgi:hypothetical protein
MQKKHERTTLFWQKWRFSASYDSFLLISTFVLRMNICSEKRHLRQARKRLHHFNKEK